MTSEEKKAKRRAWQKQYREAHREEINAKARAAHAAGKYRNKSLKQRFHKLQKGAEARGLSFDLTFDKFEELFPLPCVYCNNEMMHGGKAGDVGSGIDRIDNDKGYSDDNVQACCHDCNMIRTWVLTFEEMKVAVRAILEVRRKNANKAM